MKFSAFIEHQQKRHDIVWEGGVPWAIYKKIVMPLSHPFMTPNATNQEMRRVLKTLKKPMAIWTQDWDCKQGNWWWIVAGKPYGLDQLKSKVRYNIRHGLKHCTIEKISPKYLAENGFECYQAAMGRHYQSQSMDKKGFQRISGYEGNKGYDFWGIFYKEQLVGYSYYHLLDNVIYEKDTLFNPEFFKFHGPCALIHIITEHYLNQLGYDMIIHGWRTISHETSYQDFLVQKFNRRMVYCNLGVYYSGWLGFLAKISVILQPVLEKALLPKRLLHPIKVLANIEAAKSV